MMKIKRLLKFIRISVIKTGLRLNRGNFQFDKGIYFGRNNYIAKDRKISVGKNFFMGNECHLSCPAMIGDDVLFASRVSLVGGDHKIDNISTTMNNSGRAQMNVIIIEDDVWIGHGSIILSGVKISTGAVVAAGSVVTRDVGCNEIVGGNPARLIRKRKLLQNNE